MKRLQLLIFLGLLWSLGPSAGPREDTSVIDVNCTDTNGCFHLLGQAIESAPEGATIQLGPGVFYELPMLIDKSLTIRGTTNEGIIYTTVNGVQPGALITIQGSDHPVSTVLEGLRLQNFVGTGLHIKGSSEGNLEQLKVFLRHNSLTTGGDAIYMQGKTQLSLLDNRIRPDQSALSAEDGKLIAEGNTFIRDSFDEPPVAMLILKGVDVDFRKNHLSQLPTVRRTAGIMVLGGRYSFIENQFVVNAVGVMIGGATTADFQKNLFDNNQLGILLNTPPCVQDPPPEIRFEGVITGSENQFTFNSKADLCPALKEFPWPPGFIKQP